MNVGQFYSRRQRAVSRYIVSTAIPDDGNVSDTGNAGDDGDSDDSDGDTLYQLIDATSDSSESDDDDDDDGDVSDVSGDTGQTTDEWHEMSGASWSPPVVTKDSGPFIVLSADDSPIDYFNLLFPDSLWTELVAETNRYGQAKPNAQEETDEAEMKAFVGMTLAMAIHKLPQIKRKPSSVALNVTKDCVQQTVG